MPPPPKAAAFRGPPGPAAAAGMAAEPAPAEAAAAANEQPPAQPVPADVAAPAAAEAVSEENEDEASPWERRQLHRGLRQAFLDSEDQPPAENDAYFPGQEIGGDLDSEGSKTEGSDLDGQVADADAGANHTEIPVPPNLGETPTISEIASSASSPSLADDDLSPSQEFVAARLRQVALESLVLFHVSISRFLLCIFLMECLLPHKPRPQTFSLKF